MLSDIKILSSVCDRLKQLDEQFEGNYRLRFHLAPPLLASKDPVTGHLRKKEYGAWMMTAFRWLAGMRRFRGTALDVFGYTAERKRERALIEEYEADISAQLAGLNESSYLQVKEIAELPDDIRGFGHVKEQAMDEAQIKRQALLAALNNPQSPSQAA